MSIPLTAFRVVVIGPSDVTEVILGIRSVVDELTAEFEPRNIKLKFLHWSLLPPGIGEPQSYIDTEMSWSDLDFVIGAMWKTMGTPVADAVSGTEHECNLILKHYKLHRQPSMMFFFKHVDATTLKPDEIDEYEKVQHFRESISSKVVWKKYSDKDDLLKLVKPSLREKIEAKLSLQHERDRLTGEYPPDRTLTVEVLLSARFEDGKQTPFVVLLRNGRGEQIAIDTRFQDIQDVANWIAQSMGFAASEGISLKNIVFGNAERAIHRGDDGFELLAGTLVVEAHPQCKIRDMHIQYWKELVSEDGSKNFKVEDQRVMIKHRRPYLIRRHDGAWDLVA